MALFVSVLDLSVGKTFKRKKQCSMSGRLGRGTKDGGHAENVLVVSLQFRSPSGG